MDTNSTCDLERPLIPVDVQGMKPRWKCNRSSWLKNGQVLIGDDKNDTSFFLGIESTELVIHPSPIELLEDQL